MKIFVLVSLVLVIATVIFAAPYELSSAGGLEPLEEIVKEPLEERATRQKRAICLYIPLLGGISDLICSGTCLLVGKPGGHCDGNGECTCEE